MSLDVVVVGAGPAGVSAAAQCTRLGLEVKLLDKTGIPGGLIANAYLVENYPGLELPITGPVFRIRLAHFLDRFNVPVLKETVRTVSRGTSNGDWQVATNAGTHHSRCVVIACGTTPRTLNFLGREGVESAGRLFYDVTPILMQFKSPRVLIVGGGVSSFDYALSIARSGGEVTILCRTGVPRVPPRLHQMVQNEKRISIRLESELIRVQMVDDQLRAEMGQNAGEAGCCVSLAVRTFDALLVAIGRTSILPFLIQEPVSLNGNLSPAPGLYLCGDARLGTPGQVGIAVGDGLFCADAIGAYLQKSR